MYIFLLIFNLIFYVSSLICKKCYSEYPDITVGYRVGRATKSEGAWKEANLYVEKPTRIGVLIAITLDIILWVMNIKPTGMILLINIILPLCFMFYTEIHLRKLFDNNGVYKKEK